MCVAHPGQNPYTVWKPTYELGKGVLFNGALAPSPFAEGLVLPKKSEGKYGTPRIELSVVSDAASYSKLTGAALTASASYNGLVTTGDLSAEASFLKETAGSSTGVHMVVSSNWTGPPRKFKEGYEPKLSEKVGVFASCTAAQVH